MAAILTFSPGYGSGKVVTAGGTSASTTLAPGSHSMMLTNLGANVIYVRSGGAGVVAVDEADYPVLPGQQVTVTRRFDDTHVAYISASGGDLHIMKGEGF